MSWVVGAVVLAVATAGAAELATMRHAIERGDVDEATRAGMLAGPAVVERALAAANDRAVVLAGIVAAPAVGQREQLLPALAQVAGGPDRRTAIPAARAALVIANALAAADQPQPDDVADEDLADWRATWLAIAQRDDRWIEVRTSALATASALAAPNRAAAGEAELGFDLAAELADPDPAMRRTALALVPQPTPAALRASIAAAIASDPAPRVALIAAQTLCADLVADDPAPVLAALGAPGLARIQALATTVPDDALADTGALRDAARCLIADGTPASTAALHALTAHADGPLRAALARGPGKPGP